MRHSQIRQTLSRNLTTVLASTNSLPFPPHDYQWETLRSTIHWLNKPRASRSAYVAQATGLGKTYEFSIIIKACRGLRALVIVPDKQMIQQTTRELIQFTEGTLAHASSLKDIVDSDGKVVVEHWRGKSHDVLVTTDETFKNSFIRLKEEMSPDVIIWDECHWSYTPKAQQALAHFRNAVVICFSATPDYLTTVAKTDHAPVELDNGQTLYCPPNKMARTYYPECLDERSPKWGIEHGYLAPLAWGQLKFTLKLDEVPVVNGPAGLDFDPAELQRVMREKWDFVVQVVRQLYQSGQYNIGNRFSAAICPSVHEAQILAEDLQGIGIIAESITEKTKDTEVQKILERAKKGDIQFLSSVFKLREGWNSPNAEIAMMLRPTRSRVLYMQFLGRILRLFGNKVALALDPHYLSDRFAPLSVPVLFGEPGQHVYDGDIIVGPRGKRGRRKPLSPYMEANLHLLKPILTVEKVEIEYWAGEDGTFKADGEVWASPEPLASILKLSVPTILGRCSSCRTREGISRQGRRSTFYPLDEVKKACADLLEKSQADKDGTFTADGEVWCTVKSLERILELSERPIKKRLSSCRNRQGKDWYGHIRTFFALSDVKKACADLLKEVPQAGEDGTFTADGEVWGMSWSLALLLHLNRTAMNPRIGLCRTRQGKDKGGHIRTFLCLSDVKEACSDILLKK